MNKTDFTKSKIIAVDFDGTIVDDAYPNIGKPKLFAFETLKKLQSDGHRLILWTYRYGERLIEAIEFCEKHEIIFDAINNNFHGEEFDISKQSRKIHADLFIDDRNVGGFLGWGEIYVSITEKKNFILQEEIKEKKPQKKGWFF
jgi:hydroxymethylpyrimidine pyrophosphatase-like HAD family hydrolase